MNLGPRSYDIVVTNELNGFAEFVKKRTPKFSGAVVVGDANTAGLGSTVAKTMELGGWPSLRSVGPASNLSAAGGSPQTCRYLLL